jgi:hypothetical protein
MRPYSGSVRRRAFATASALVVSATPIAAQYPLSPTPVLPFALFSPQPNFTGYVSVRETFRDDTATFSVNRARITLHVLPVGFAALRVQADFSAVGRASGDTVPAILLTDAYVELVAPDTSSRAARLFRPALVIGQFRTPFSLEYLTPFSLLTTVNRSQPVERLSTRRDLGALGQVRVARFATLTGAVVNGEGPNRTSNPDGKQMAVGRLTAFPLSSLALSAKWLGQSGDHRWGYDGRWLARGFIVEGEAIKRTGPAGADAVLDASGGYILAAYRILPWLQPVVKWERLRETTTIASVATERRLTWTTYGINFSAAQERLRFQLDWIAKSDRPTRASDELVAQLQAVF